MTDRPRLLSDQNLDLLLQETPWGRGGVDRLIRSGPDPTKLRTFWTGLTIYRQGGQHFQNQFDQALSAAQGRNAWEPQLRAIAMTKRDMLAAPGDYPFCLTGQQWREHCQSLFGGMIDSTDYKPPSAMADLKSLVIKTLVGTFIGAVATYMIPEEALVATAAAGLGGNALKGMTMAIGSEVTNHLLPGGSPLDDLDKAEIWRRYQLESRRRKLP